MVKKITLKDMEKEIEEIKEILEGKDKKIYKMFGKNLEEYKDYISSINSIIKDKNEIKRMIEINLSLQYKLNNLELLYVHKLYYYNTIIRWLKYRNNITMLKTDYDDIYVIDNNNNVNKYECSKGYELKYGGKEIKTSEKLFVLELNNYI